MGTVAANPTPPSPSSCGVKVESLTHIDITKLSQSELQALSLCSNSALDLRSTDETVSPRIDRAVFNESAGSRRQTYSRIRGGFHQQRRTRLPGLLPGPKLPPASDPENHCILHYLKHYVNHNSSSNCPPPPPPPSPPPPPVEPPSPPPQPVVLAGLQQQLGLGLKEKMAMAVHAAETKRKRGRKAKAKVKVSRRLLENGAGMELVRVNKNGNEVDFASLERKGDDLYSGELEKRTTGLETEEEVLEVLRGLEGQWGSRRKRRKYVDACVFGDALPIGWKLLLGLRRRDGRVSLYCRRIVSPFGEQFLSCKEASSFLRSYFEGKDLNQPIDQGKFIMVQANGVASGSTAGSVDNTSGPNSTLVALTTSDGQENEVCLMEIDNLPEVQVQDIFECYKCNLIFHEKNVYLNHLMSVHERTTRRYKVGASIGEGVIIKDGKFECQFCHKVFLERRSYNGHVGVHVRNHGKGSEELPVLGSVQKSTESPAVECSHTRTSKMNALIEIAQNSMVAASSAGCNSEPVDNSCPSMMNLNEALVDNGNDGANLGSDPIQIETGNLKSNSLDQEVDKGGCRSMVSDGETGERDDREGSMHDKSPCTNVSEHTDSRELEKCGNNDIDAGNELAIDKLSDDIANSKGLMAEENFALTSSSVLLEPSVQYFPDVAHKGGDDLLSVHQKLEKVTTFEELGFDEMEPFKYGFVDKQEPSSLPGISFDLANDAGTEEGFDSSVGLDAEAIISDMAGMHQVTTVCVWCRAEFKVDAFDTETQSDTIGYMCPTCKDKISGHFDRICPSGGW